MIIATDHTLPHRGGSARNLLKVDGIKEILTELYALQGVSI